MGSFHIIDILSAAVNPHLSQPATQADPSPTEIF